MFSTDNAAPNISDTGHICLFLKEAFFAAHLSEISQSEWWTLRILEIPICNPWCWYISLQNWVILFGPWYFLVNIPAPWGKWDRNVILSAIRIIRIIGNRKGFVAIDICSSAHGGILWDIVWLLVDHGWPTPLKNDGLSEEQLGWWHSQLNGQKKHVPNHQPVVGN